MPGGLGTLDELFEAATLIQCQKIGPFPLVLMGEKSWDGMRKWGQFTMRQPGNGRSRTLLGIPHPMRENLTPSKHRRGENDQRYHHP